MQKSFYVVLFTVILASCASLKPGAEKVRIGKSDPEKNCKELGDVVTSAAFCDEACQKIVLKNKALELGGNYVRLESLGVQLEGGATNGSGTAYSCPESK